jgi:capsular exopolysaccharide synthesis family protein
MGFEAGGSSAKPEGDGPGKTRALIAGGETAPARWAGPDTYGYSDYGSPPSGGEGSDLSATFRQLLHIGLKRKWLILSIALAFTILGSVRSLMKTPLYMATVRIQIDRTTAKIVESTTQTQSTEEDPSNDFMRTQYELLKSRAISERVVSSLGLAEDAGLFKPRTSSLLSVITGSGHNETLPLSARQEGAVDIVQGNIAVLPVSGSRLIDLSYTDISPDRAQRIANGYADAYIAANLDKRFVANSYAKSFLEDQIKQLKIRMEDSEKALLEFAEREKMVEVTDKASIAENNLAAANAAVGQLISDRVKSEHLWRQVDAAKAINLPQLLSNSVIDVLRGQRKALETEYQEKLENLKPSYPAMVQIANKLKEVDRQLAAEVNTIRSSLKAAYETSLAQENEMKARIETLREEVLNLQKKGIQYNILKRDVETNRGLYNGLLQRYKEIDIAGGVGTNNIFIVDKAALPDGPFEPNLRRAMMLSLVLGLGAGVGIAFLLETIDDRIRAPEEVEQLSGLTTLGIIPRMEEEELVDALSDPRTPISEAYRSLATALQFSTESGLPKSIAVTSAGPSEGKSVTAIAISRYFAQVGLRVLLVDADLRKPSLHTKLRMSNYMGFSNYLTGSSLPPDLVQKTDHRNLVFMASGPLPPNAADLLSGTRLLSLISLGSEVFDLIVFDSPPVLGLADTQLLGSAAAATIFVVGAGNGSKAMMRSALRRLQLARVKPIGTVLTKFDPKSVGFGYAQDYGYGGYGYRYEGAYAYRPALESDDTKKRIPERGESS